jgi:Protein of unknown function (DUF1565)
MQLKIIAFTALLASASARPATYWVSLSGSDSNVGTFAAPFRHVSKAAAAARNPGDKVIVMPGTYDNEGVTGTNYVVNLKSSGASGNPITFVSQIRGQAILDGGNTSNGASCTGAAAYFNLGNVSFVVIQGFVIQNSCSQGIESIGAAHDITIRWNEICNIANYIITDQYGRDGIYMTSSQYNFTFDGNLWHDIGRVSGTPMLDYDHGIYSSGQNLTIVNNVFYNMNRGWSIQIANGAANWMISNNTFAFPDANGAPGQIVFWEGNNTIKVQNNIFYEPAVSALNTVNAVISNSEFQSNLIYGVNNVFPPSLFGVISGLLLGSNTIGPNPMFVNASTPPYNFALQPGSPAAGLGMTTPSITLDFNGAPRTKPPAAGAFNRP